MNKYFFSFLCLVFYSFATFSQQKLDYYLPEKVILNPAIPTPASIIGHEVGEWHITHDRLVQYMYALDQASDRISLEVLGKTYEGRPLVMLTITSPKNQQNIEAIRQEHLQLTDASKSGSLDLKKLPAVFYLGCSIHGNEASGVNAALLMGYYLAAAQGPEIEAYLQNTVILFDPNFNPDGIQRFASWVNARKSMQIATDANDIEHNEAWPGGRFNHYWFDLNRDWLVAQHPESQARVKKFQAWRPNVLTDHHEQGTNATFFFMPGVPSRVHPLTPEKNQELTRKMGTYHAKALEEIGSLYFTQEGYDDFYYGKGSTYPDIQGCIGILFEQASSRGHAQESTNGVLTFPFTIRNQFVTMLSSLKAVNEMREELLAYQRDFYKNAAAEAAKDAVKAIVFSSGADRTKGQLFAEMMLRQQVQLQPLTTSQTINGKAFDKDNSYVVPLNQPQYKLIQSMFYKQLKFKDSLFYDISSWTLPLAFGVDYEELKVLPALGATITTLPKPQGKIVGTGDYAFVMEPFGYYMPRALYRLLKQGIRVKVANEVFNAAGRRFERGSLVIPGEQEKTPQLIQSVLQQIVSEDAIDVYALSSGLDYQGVSLGSSSFTTLRKPEIAMVVEGGVSPTDAGEIWHLLDARLQMPVTLLSVNSLNTVPISRYNTLILPEGNYAALTDATKEKLRAWVQNGGVLIGFERAVSWLQGAGLAKFDMKKDEEKKEAAKSKPYSSIDEDRGALETSGAIFEAEADLTHPLLYGYTASRIPLFKSNNLFMEKAKNVYGNPLVFGGNPLVTGYIAKANYDRLKNSSCVGVSAQGRGRVIGFTENQAFRAFWFGTNRLLTNAIFMGPIISAEAGR
jgi:hypothetical protein